MKVVHNIRIEVFLYPTEDFKKVKKSLDLILPEKAKIEKEEVESYYGPAIGRLTYFTDKAADIKRILGNIVSNLSEEDRREIIGGLDKRLDENGSLFLRFDKQSAYNGKLILGYQGDVIKTEVKLASYPVTLNNLKHNAKIIFEG
jgi:hypothetical protein